MELVLRYAMISGGFALEHPALGARIQQDELRCEDVRVFRTQHAGAVRDEALDPPIGERATAWSRVRVVLDGPAYVRAGGGVTVTPGAAYGSSFMQAETARSSAPWGDWLDVMWRNGSRVGSALPSGTVLRLSTRTFDQARLLGDALTSRDVPAVTRGLGEVLEGLRAEGLPLAGAALATSELEADGTATELARALEPLVSTLSSRPMMVDLAGSLHICERQAARRADRYFARYHTGAASWREFIHNIRLEMANFFMGAPNARTEVVSRFLGFSSPTGLCHALHAAGLPSPQAIHRELRT